MHWREFSVGDLFEKILRGNISKQGDLEKDAMGISFIAQNDECNGYVCKVRAENHRVFEAHSIIIGRQTGVSYYQPEPFVTTDGVLVLTNHKIIKNRFVGLFLTSLLAQQLRIFGYSYTVSSAKLKALKIALPTMDGKIAFDFMETFISAVQKEAIKSVILWKQKRTNATKAIVENR
ncbi:restriction endonuclease subunit S [Helicobacter sp. 23-1045]